MVLNNLKTNKMKQTAVEWLINEMHKKEQGLIETSYNHLFDQAKEIERQQKGYSEEDMKEMYLKGIENYDSTFKKK